MQLYLVRHGETEWNKQYRYYGRTDIPLNDEGRRQAEKIGDLLKDISFDKIYSSPLLRAKQTEEMIAHRKNGMAHGERKITLELAEQDLGIFEGYTYQELQTHFPEQVKMWNEDFKKAPHGGETFDDFYKRIFTFCEKELEIEGLQQRKQESRKQKQFLMIPKEREQEKILIVSHLAVIRCLFTILLGMDEDAIWSFTVEQGAYSRIDIEDGYAIIRKINQSL